MASVWGGLSWGLSGLGAVLFNLQGALMMMMELQSRASREKSITHAHTHGTDMDPAVLAAFAKRKSVFFNKPHTLLLIKIWTVSTWLAVSKPTRMWRGAVAKHNPALICWGLLAKLSFACSNSVLENCKQSSRVFFDLQFSDSDVN